MREILFRGKENPSGKWVEGFLVGHCHIGDWVSCTPIHSKTLGQFTGMTDKNGKKIFEGDILRLGGDDLPHWYEEGMVVAVSYECDGFIPLCEYDSDCGTYVDSTKCEVIGNIHDNPELLEDRQ